MKYRLDNVDRGKAICAANAGFLVVLLAGKLSAPSNPSTPSNMQNLQCADSIVGLGLPRCTGRRCIWCRRRGSVLTGKRFCTHAMSLLVNKKKVTARVAAQYGVRGQTVGEVELSLCPEGVWYGDLLVWRSGEDELSTW